MNKRSKKSLSLFLILALSVTQMPQTMVQAAGFHERQDTAEQTWPSNGCLISQNGMIQDTIRDIIPGSITQPIAVYDIIAHSTAVQEMIAQDIAGHKYETALHYAISNGLLSVTDGKVSPDEYITKGEALQGLEILVGAAEKKKNLKITNLKTTDPYYEAVAIALNTGFISLNSGNTVYNPHKIATNEYISRILAKIMCMSTKKIAGYTGGSKAAKQKITRAEFANLLYLNIPNIISEDGDTALTGNVIINRPAITISNQTIKGNVLIGEGAKDGEVNLSNVTVTGKVVVHGDVNVTVSGKAGTLILKGEGANVSVTKANVSSLILAAAGTKAQIAKESKANKVSMTVAAESSELMLAGEAVEIETQAKNSVITVAEAGKAGTIHALEKASGAVIRIEENGTCDFVDVEAQDVTLTSLGSYKNIDSHKTNLKIINPLTPTPTITPIPTSAAGGTGGGVSGGGSGTGGGSMGGGGVPAPTVVPTTTPTLSPTTTPTLTPTPSPTTPPMLTPTVTPTPAPTPSLTLTNLDPRFAPGYPVIERIARSAGSEGEDYVHVRIRIKLKEGAASEQSPVEIYTVSSYWTDRDATSEAVLHGHLGDINKDGSCFNDPAELCDYVRITDDQEYVLAYSREKTGLPPANDFITYFALQQNDILSDEPVKAVLAGEETDTEKRTVGAYMYSAFMSAEQQGSVSGSGIRTIRIYTYNDLDKHSVPEKEAFQLTNAEGCEVLAVTVGETESGLNGYPNITSYVELTIGCIEKTDMSRMRISYSPETSEMPLKAEDDRLVLPFVVSTSGQSEIVNGKYYSGVPLYDRAMQNAEMWISGDGTYFSIQTGTFMVESNQLGFESSDLEYYLDGKKLNLDWYSVSYLGNHALFQKIGGEPVIVTKNSIFEIRKKDESLFYDMSGCEIGQSVIFALSVHQENEEIGVALYDTNMQQLRVELYSSGVELYFNMRRINGCHFKISNGTTTYQVRGKVIADRSGLYFDIRSFKHMGELKWEECTLEFENSDNYFEALKNKSGKPLSDFSQAIWVLEW
ncbi:MAG: S-layer homology domain-containing protein [Lachnospiraceae bacterium]|nr:S-layer homology domain-containing protein [Lachnospiraceae bacterium]